MQTDLQLIPNMMKNKIVIMKSLKIIWLQSVQGKSCWMCLELYTLISYLHIENEQFCLMIFGYFV